MEGEQSEGPVVEGGRRVSGEEEPGWASQDLSKGVGCACMRPARPWGVRRARVSIMGAVRMQACCVHVHTGLLQASVRMHMYAACMQCCMHAARMHAALHAHLSMLFTEFCSCMHAHLSMLLHAHLLVLLVLNLSPVSATCADASASTMRAGRAR